MHTILTVCGAFLLYPLRRVEYSVHVLVVSGASHWKPRDHPASPISTCDGKFNISPCSKCSHHSPGTQHRHDKISYDVGLEKYLVSFQFYVGKSMEGRNMFPNRASRQMEGQKMKSKERSGKDQTRYACVDCRRVYVPPWRRILLGLRMLDFLCYS